jgi:hypothetical protein
MLAISPTAHAHGIVGNRLFPGTLAFDDPAVADELNFPAFSNLKHPGEGGDVVDNRFDYSFTRLLTPTLAAVIESGWIHRNWGPSQRSGFETTNLGLKGLLYKNEPHEIMVSAGVTLGNRVLGRSRSWCEQTGHSPTRHFLRQGFRRSPGLARVAAAVGYYWRDHRRVSYQIYLFGGRNR